MIDQAYIDRLIQQEKDLEFEHFSREDAFEVGMIMHKNAKERPEPVGFEITINGVRVFQSYSTGITQDHQLWLERKRNSVEFREMSSLRLEKTAEMHQMTPANWLVDPTKLGLTGGGFPIVIKGTGMIGSICVSGYAGEDDHQLIVNSITEFLKKI